MSKKLDHAIEATRISGLWLKDHGWLMGKPGGYFIETV
jgi:hypothetical protein